MQLSAELGSPVQSLSRFAWVLKLCRCATSHQLSMPQCWSDLVEGSDFFTQKQVTQKQVRLHQWLELKGLVRKGAFNAPRPYTWLRGQRFGPIIAAVAVSQRRWRNAQPSVEMRRAEARYSNAALTLLQDGRCREMPGDDGDGMGWALLSQLCGWHLVRMGWAFYPFLMFCFRVKLMKLEWKLCQRKHWITIGMNEWHILAMQLM